MNYSHCDTKSQGKQVAVRNLLVKDGQRQYWCPYTRPTSITPSYTTCSSGKGDQAVYEGVILVVGLV